MGGTAVQIREKVGMIKLLFMDIDGTLTDGKIYIAKDGEFCKAFDIKDGYGIHDILPHYKIIPVVITARESEIVSKRCVELGIFEVYQNCRNKKQKMIEISKKYGIMLNENNILEQTAYIGDDILDLQCMTIAQLKGCPADSVDEIKEVADFISDKNGGEGAVREFIEWLCIDK